MAWRFSERGRRIVWAGRDVSPADGFDANFGRKRWPFAGVLQRAASAAGKPLTPEQAVAAIQPEFRTALDYLDAQPADESVFGVIYDVSSGAVVKDKDGAERSRKNAATYIQTGSEQGSEGGGDVFLEEAATILYRILKEDNPNHLAAQLSLVRCLHQLHRPEALAELCDLYCRLASAGLVMERMTAADPVRQRMLEAYKPFRTSGFMNEVMSTADLLGARIMFDPMRLTAFALGDDGMLEEWAGYIQLYDINWLIKATVDESHMGYYGFGPGTIVRLQRSIKVFFKLWKKANLRVYPARMKQMLVKCIEVLDSILGKVSRTDVRLRIFETLGEIPLLETVPILQKHLQNADAASKPTIERALISIGQTLSGAG